MAQILVTIDSDQPLQSVQRAIRKLRGVVATTVVNDPAEDETRRQEAYVEQSLTRALQEVKQSRTEGRKLQSLDDFLDELQPAH